MRHRTTWHKEALTIDPIYSHWRCVVGFLYIEFRSAVTGAIYHLALRRISVVASGRLQLMYVYDWHLRIHIKSRRRTYAFSLARIDHSFIHSFIHFCSINTSKTVLMTMSRTERHNVL